MHSKVCAICFATDCRLYTLTDPSIGQAYAMLIGSLVAGAVAVARRRVCGACARRLRNCAHLRARCRRAHAALLRLGHVRMSPDSIKSIIAEQSEFKSDRLEIKHHKPDWYDLEIQHVENQTFEDTRSIRVKEESDPLQLNKIRYDDATTGYVEMFYDYRAECDVKAELTNETEDPDMKMTCVYIKDEDLRNDDIGETSGDIDKDPPYLARTVITDRKHKPMIEDKESKILPETNENRRSVLVKRDLKETLTRLAAGNTTFLKNNITKEKRNLQFRSRTHSGEKFDKRNLHFKRKADCENPSGEKPRSDEKLLCCHICKKSYKNKTILTTHLRIHTGEKPFSCDICGKAFYARGHLRTHLRTHSGEKPFSCDVCLKAFSERGHLRNHSRVHSGEKPYTCSICNKSFTRSGTLKIHVREHSGERPFSCNICQKTFSKTEKLRSHLRIHSGEKPYTCNICNRNFSDKSNLQKHLRIHSGTKPYACGVCKKTFRQNSVLRTHLRTHSGEKPYACEICVKAFSVKSHLLRHLRTHTGEKPHSCNVCKKTFSVKDSLQKHLRTHSCNIVVNL